MNHKIRPIIQFLLFAYGFLGLLAGANAVLIFEDDFESGNLDKWTIGGRQLAGANIADTVTRYGSTMGHLYKTSFTEITLENSFVYDPLMNIMLNLEVTSNGTTGASNFYAYSGVDFNFLDSTGTRIGRVWYGTASTNYLSSLAANDPTWLFNEVTEGTLLNLDLAISDMLSSIAIDTNLISTVNMRLRTYTSYYGTASAELWVDNVCIDQGDICRVISVPEPSALTLIFIALAGIGYSRHRSNNTE